MKLTDYIANFLALNDVTTVFGFTGGAVVHFFDSIEKHPELDIVFCHHEQAASFAAPAYSKMKRNIGVCITSTGPGSTNAVTGVLGAWQDSIPCIFISGQSRLEHSSRDKNVRQIGAQEFDIISLVKPITKYAVMVTDPKNIRYHLEKAMYLAKEGRPGPVWVDIPLNFQWMDIEVEALKSFPSEKERVSPGVSESDLSKFESLFNKASRPLILVGNGIRLGHAEDELITLLDTWNIPFVSSWAACDIIHTAHPLYCGRIGMAGQRGGNLAVQNCDLLIAIGSHLSIPLTGTRTDYFSRESKRVMVDIDDNELLSETVRIDLKINANADDFLSKAIAIDSNKSLIEPWINKCQLYNSYNKCSNTKYIENFIDQYHFMGSVNKFFQSNDTIVVDGGGTVVYSTFQTLKIAKGQRVICSSSIGAMGSGLAESIGVCKANNGNNVILFVGDGSMQLNIQELQTIKHHNFPIKIFIINNGGYLSIRQTQREFLEGKFIGAAEDGGMSLPNYNKISVAYGLDYKRIDNHNSLEEDIKNVLEIDGPMVCEVMINPKQEIIPSQGFVKNPDGTGFPRPLEDMYPYLDRDEFKSLMIVKPLDVSND